MSQEPAIDKSRKTRNWCFTINNPTEDPTLPPTAKYLIFGREVAPETGTPHLQCFIIFKSQVRFNTVKTLFPRANIRACDGSAAQNITYCMKDGDFIELGTAPISKRKQGEMEAERWEEAWESAKKGNLDDVPADIRLRYYNTLKTIAKDHMVMPPSNPTLESEWWYGASGTGKSREAYDTYPTAYRKMCNKWWDGYRNEETVILEDLDQKHGVLVHHLKLWADHHPFIAEVKGGASAIRPKRIIVTSNVHPAEIWTDAFDIEPILRRFKLREFK